MTTAALAAAFCVLVLIVVGGLAGIGEHPFTYYSGDPADTLSGSPVVGLMSHAGVMLSWGAAAICLFVGLFLWWLRGLTHVVPLLVLGSATAYLAADDLFMLHERIFPDQVGISQKLVLAVYGLLALAFFWRFREFFREYDLPLLALSIACVVASVVIDVEARDLLVHEGLKRWAEDGVKLFGVAFFAAYLVRLSARMLAESYERAPADTAAPSDVSEPGQTT